MRRLEKELNTELFRHEGRNIRLTEQGRSFFLRAERALRELDQGFGEEAICLAADRTLTNTGALKWNYLRKILQSWHERGLHTPQEIREKDPARSAAPAKAPEKPGSKPIDKDALLSILDKI